MRRYLILLFKVCLVLVGPSVSTFGANQIQCRVQTPPDYPLPEDVQVNLSMLSAGRLDSAIPQGNGRFSFEGLRPGRYVISVRADGFQPVDEQVEIPSGYIHNIVNLVIRLTPAPPASETPRGEKTVAVQTLKVPQGAVDEIGEAEKAAARGRLQKAILHAEKAVEIYPDYFQAYNNLAVYHYQAGDKEKAVTFLQKALSLNPDAVGANSNLGRIYLELENPKAAVQYLKHASEIDQRSAEIQYHLGRAYILSFQFSESLEPLRRALDLEPPVSHARFLLAHVLYGQGDKSGAIEQLELYLKTKPKNRRELEQRLDSWKAELDSSGR